MKNEHLFSLAIVAIVAIVALFALSSPIPKLSSSFEVSSVGQGYSVSQDPQSIFSDEFISEAYDIAYEITYINGVDYYFDTYGDSSDNDGTHLRGGSTTVYYTTHSGNKVSIKRRAGSSTVIIKVNPPGWGNGMSFRVTLNSNPESLVLTGSHGVRCTATPTENGGTYVKCNSKTCELSEIAREQLGDDCEEIIGPNLLEEFDGPLRGLILR